MKIVKIETLKCWAGWCNGLCAKVSSGEGLYARGEGSLRGAIESVETAIHELGAALVGQDPSGVERHWQAMHHARLWRGSPTLMTAPRAAQARAHLIEA